MRFYLNILCIGFFMGSLEQSFSMDAQTDEEKVNRILGALSALNLENFEDVQVFLGDSDLNASQNELQLAWNIYLKNKEENENQTIQNLTNLLIAWNFENFAEVQAILNEAVPSATQKQINKAWEQYQNSRKNASKQPRVRKTESYVKNGFIMMPMKMSYGNEMDVPGNTPDIKELSVTHMDDGKIVDKDGKELNTEGSQAYIFVMNSKGVIYAKMMPELLTRYICNNGRCKMHHSFFLKGKPTNEDYGIGKDVAMAGWMKVVNGKITYIESHSGHYQPSIDAFKMAVIYLASKNVLFHDSRRGRIRGNVTLLANGGALGLADLYVDEILKMDPEDIEYILDKYR